VASLPQNNSRVMEKKKGIAGRKLAYLSIWIVDFLLNPSIDEVILTNKYFS